MTQVMYSTLHVRFDGRSEEVSLTELELASTATDEQIKLALVAHFDLASGHLDDYMVVRTSTAIIVHPEAVYG